ncbi:Uncharacterized protein LOK49_LG05G01989 [Camellia lanceoleosa]|uniref:Uncharacterized protein n=1 Tax=Camellia lanceoleosa TaxID=1840588 RepID=A0ACC0HLZ1_9ERIC|nr:Uncharacterized protein LOK49_LG05G01989 [Camellia lanceoleosa]
MGSKDWSKVAIGLDNAPVDEDVRRKVVEVNGIKNALLLKTRSRVSLLRKCWGTWFDAKSDFLMRKKDQASGGDGGGASLPCIQKLLPCQPYLQKPLSPPDTCCEPLKEMISGDSACLCGIFDNADLLKKFNITQDVALKLPKACGANADVSVCKTESSAPSVSPATHTPATPSNSTSPSNTTTTTANNAANWIPYFGGSSFILIIVNLFLAAI